MYASAAEGTYDAPVTAIKFFTFSRWSTLSRFCKGRHMSLRALKHTEGRIGAHAHSERVLVTIVRVCGRADADERVVRWGESLE